MTVLDAYALIAFLAGEPAAGAVEAHLRAAGPTAHLSALNLAEVVDRLVRAAGQPEEAVFRRLEWLASGGLTVVAVDEPIGRLAGVLRARHYRRAGAAVSLADCVALATARLLDEGLSTADPALASIARAEGVPVLGLPDSRGRVP